MIGNVYVLFKDKWEWYTKTFYEHKRDDFQKLNKDNYWVYCSVNDFEATEQEMKDMWVSTKRNIPFLKKINWAFADLDIAKKWDWQSQQEKEMKKANLLWELFEKCNPSIVVETANWLQPVWRLKDTNTSTEYQKRYVDVINWIIERSKTVWASGDQVKDVTRVLRLPWYYHMKEEPFKCIERQNNDIVYSIEDLEKVFWEYIPKEDIKEKHKKIQEYDTSEQYRAIDNLDFQELIIRAFRKVWRSCEFDNKWRVILDWRLTGTFQWKRDDKEYLASTSHEPFEWNKITAVADIMQTTYKEAYKRIIDEFNIANESSLKKKKPIIDIKKEVFDIQWYVYPSDVFDDFDCIISWELVTIVAESNSWKTTFAMDIIEANSKIGKRWFYINCEFAIDTMWKSRWLYLNWKKKRDISDLAPMSAEDRAYMENYVNKKLSQFDYYNQPNWIELEDLVNKILEKKKEWFNLFVLDTFSRIKWNLDSWTARTSQNKSMEVLQELCQNTWITLIVLHHTNRKWTFEGSQKIMDLSNVFIIMTKETDAEWEEYRTFTLSKDKFVSSKSIDVWYRQQQYFRS